MSLLGSIAGPLISGGLGLLGGRKAKGNLEEALAAMQQMSRPIDITGPFGFSRFNEDDEQIETGLSDSLAQALGQLGTGRGLFHESLIDPDFITNEVDRLRTIARPRENQLRNELRSRLFNRGRLGLGTGDTLTGQFANPETAALEEAFARADAARIDQARGIRQQELGNFLGLLGAEQNLSLLPLEATRVGIAARPQSAALQGARDIGQQGARFNESFFGSLGENIGGIFGDLFGGGSSGGGSQASNFIGPFGFSGLGLF